MCIPPNPDAYAAHIGEHIRLVELARAEYEEDGLVSTTTFMAMTDAGLMAEEIIEDITGDTTCPMTTQS